jgi:hypothetical protein
MMGLLRIEPVFTAKSRAERGVRICEMLICAPAEAFMPEHCYISMLSTQRRAFADAGAGRRAAGLGGRQLEHCKIPAKVSTKSLAT